MFRGFAKTTLLIVAGVAVGLVAASFFGLNSSTSETVFRTEVDADNPLINPTVTAGLDKHYIINVQPLKDSIIEIIERYSHKTYVYFAYLNNDSWIGINEREYFTAASTVKVPLAMSLMRAVEEKKISLESSYTVTEKDVDERYGSFHERALGNSYTLDELLKIMLEESDNTATLAIINALGNIGENDPFERVYTFMGWDNYSGFGRTPEYFAVNLKVLSNMFLALYNAKYISVDHSQEILEYLDNANFNSQIVAGVPKSVAVAHKTGEQEEEKVYSDCGIVYAPNRHYLLCLASAGVDKLVADKFSKEVSEEVYNYVISN